MRRSRSRDGRDGRDARGSRDQREAPRPAAKDAWAAEKPEPVAAAEVPPQTPLQGLSLVEARLGEACAKVQEAIDITEFEEVKLALARAQEELRRAAEVVAQCSRQEEQRAQVLVKLQEAVFAPTVEGLREALAIAEQLCVAPGDLEEARQALVAQEHKWRILQQVQESIADPSDIAKVQAAIAEAEGANVVGPEVEAARRIVQEAVRQQAALGNLRATFAIAQQQQSAVDSGASNASPETCRQLRHSLAQAEQCKVPEAELQPVRTLLEALSAQEQQRQQQRQVEDQQRQQVLGTLSSAIQQRDVAAVTSAIEEARRIQVDESHIAEAQMVLLQLQQAEQLAASAASTAMQSSDSMAAAIAAAIVAATALAASHVTVPTPPPPAPPTAVTGAIPPGGLQQGVLLGGTVKRWDANKGFGFIVPDTAGPDCFVHGRDLEDGDFLVVGSRVVFEAIIDPSKGPGKYRARVKSGAQRRDVVAAEVPASDRLYVVNLPAEITEEQIAAIFGQYGSLAFVKKLPQNASKPSSAAALVGLSDLAQAKWIHDNVGNQIPLGLTTPVAISYAAETTASVNRIPDSAVATAADRLYILGLPLEISEDQIAAVFSQYGPVSNVKKLAVVHGKTDSAALVKMVDPQRAKWLVDNVNRNIPVGLTSPIMVSFAKEGTGASSAAGPPPPPQALAAQYPMATAAPAPPPPAPAPAPAGGSEIIIDNVPAGTSEEVMSSVIGQYGAIISVRKLPDAYLGAPHSSFAVLMHESSQAKWVVDNLNRNIPVGLSFPVGVRFAQLTTARNGYGPAIGSHAQAFQSPYSSGAGCGGALGAPSSLPPPPPPSAPAAAAPAPTPQEPTNQLFVEGLPLGSPEDAVKSVFAQYGAVISVSVVPPIAGDRETTAFIFMSEVGQAKWLVENLNRNIPVGLSTPVRLSYAASAASSVVDTSHLLGALSLPPQPQQPPVGAQVPEEDFDMMNFLATGADPAPLAAEPSSPPGSRLPPPPPPPPPARAASAAPVAVSAATAKWSSQACPPS